MIARADIHNIHPYPCKFPAASIRNFLEPAGHTLLDPFCGSGTTTYEAAAAGWKCVIGIDANPIATLISRFKTLKVEPRFFKRAELTLKDFFERSKLFPITGAFTFAGRDHWFSRAVQRDLSRIVGWIEENQDERQRLWLKLALSRIVNRVSRQDSETRYVAVTKFIAADETLRLFHESASALLHTLSRRPPLRSDVVIYDASITSGLPLEACSVDRIVTSPPYANSMDYYLYHKQRMNVLSFDFKTVQDAEIGSRHEYSSKRAGVEKWTLDYDAMLAEFARTLRPGGDAILIIGDSQIAGQKIDAAQLTATLSEKKGFHFELLDSTPLSGRSKSFSHAFQRPNKFEHVIRLVRPSAAA